MGVVPVPTEEQHIPGFSAIELGGLFPDEEIIDPLLSEEDPPVDRDASEYNLEDYVLERGSSRSMDIPADGPSDGEGMKTKREIGASVWSSDDTGARSKVFIS